jgi:hypothetical protein
MGRGEAIPLTVLSVHSPGLASILGKRPLNSLIAPHIRVQETRRVHCSDTGRTAKTVCDRLIDLLPSPAGVSIPPHKERGTRALTKSRFVIWQVVIAVILAIQWKNRHVSKVACRARVSFRYAAPPARRGSWPSDDPSRGTNLGAAVDRAYCLIR